MSNLVIVAIPDENDRVWKVSSEKIPHLTVLFLGDVDDVSNTDQITQFVEHAANTTLKRFYLPVDYRGELGDDKADVLFFKKGRYDYKAIRDFRVQLLKDNNIRTAYDATTQFEGPWTPHLTLGYPETPAKPEDDNWGGFYDVSFNRIAVWFGDYEGPEFMLKDHWDEWDTLEFAPLDVAMSSMGEMTLADIRHYGVKGMRWGVRKEETRGETGTAKSWFDPEGHDLATDVAKNLIYGTVMPPLAIPSSVRLTRGAARGAKAKIQDVAEKRDDKKFEKVAKSQEGFAAIHNGSVDRFNSDVKKINQKYTEADLAKPAKKKTYDAEILKSMQESYKDSANRIGNKRGTKHLDVEFHNDGMDFTIKVREGQQKPTVEKVKHAAIDDDDTVTFAGKIKRAATGHIVKFDFEDFDEAGAQHSVEEDGAEYLVYRGLMSTDYFLEHFGVKGMRWGVRKEDLAAVGRAAKSTGGKLGKAASALGRFAGDTAFEANLNNETSRNSINMSIDSKARKAFKRTDLPAIKAKPEHQKAAKLKNRLLHPLDPGTKAYRKDAREAYIKRLEEAANQMTNASGTRQYTIRERGWELPPEGGALPKSKHYWEVTSREIKHAEGDEETWTVEAFLDDDGFITDLQPVNAEDALTQMMDLGAEFLEHYGVKGMQWGVRRNREAPLAVHPTGRSRVPHGNKRRTKIDVEGGQNHPAHEDAIAVAEAKAKLKKSGVSALSNSDLQKMAKRLQLETQVAQLTSSRGQKFVQRQLEQQGQQTVQRGVASVGKKVAKKAGKAAATTAVTVALL